MKLKSEKELINLAQSLPPTLLNFFRRFPPGNQYAQGPQRPSPPPPSAKASDVLKSSIAYSDPTFNPFQPWKNPITGRWRGAMYGLRRQALIVKRARHHGVEELLPYSTKLSWVKTEKREAQGLRVKGTGVGQKVKGKEWERTQKGRLEKRRTAMLKMPEMIQQWKERGHGRGWKKWPK